MFVVIYALHGCAKLIPVIACMFFVGSWIKDCFLFHYHESWDLLQPPVTGTFSTFIKFMVIVQAFVNNFETNFIP